MKKLINARNWALMPLAAGMLLVSLLAGCASNPEARQSNGTLKLSSEVSQIFETYRVLPNHRYYFSGSTAKPRAIIGIDQNYSLNSQLWKEAADLNSEQLKRWVDQMLGFRPAARTFGSSILSGNGEQVGVWYSPYNNTPVAVQADNRIEIIPPSEARQPGFNNGFGGMSRN